jgi:FixJ family two-component response regulator
MSPDVHQEHNECRAEESELACKARLTVATIIITAHGDEALGDRAESPGVVAILAKPLRNSSLFAAINAARRAKMD